MYVKRREIWTKCETDLIFGIYENTDCTGHGIEFNVKNPAYAKAFVDIDRFSYQLIEHIESRKSYDKEDWLIIAVTDHGGKGTGHGGQSVYERTVSLRQTRILSEKKVKSRIRRQEREI